MIETACGPNRTLLAVLANAYREEAVPGEQEGRTVMSLHPALAPIKAGVFPLTKKDGQPELAHKLADELRQRFPVFYDEAGAIGRRYRRQDEAGTPFCITIDDKTSTTDEKTVTIRHRDDMGQLWVPMAQVGDRIARYLTADIPVASSTRDPAGK